MPEPKQSHVDNIAEGEFYLPDLPDLAFYKAYGNPTLKPCYSLFIIKGCRVELYPYYHLSERSYFERTSDGDSIVLLYQDAKICITGNNLWRMWDYVGQHRMPWIRMADRAMSEDGEKIIVNIDINQLGAGD